MDTYKLIPPPEAKNLTELIRYLASELPNLKLNHDDYSEMRAEIATVGAQLGSSRPKRLIVQECLKTLKDLLEKAPNKTLALKLLERIE